MNKYFSYKYHKTTNTSIINRKRIHKITFGFWRQLDVAELDSLFNAAALGDDDGDAGGEEDVGDDDDGCDCDGSDDNGTIDVFGV